MKKKIMILALALVGILGACESAGADESVETEMQTNQNVVEDDTTKVDVMKIQTESGNFNISIKNVHTVEWSYSSEGMKIATIQAEVENIDYSGFTDNSISAYEICENGICLQDSDGFDLEFVDISGEKDGKYEVSADIKVASKKRVSLPFFVPEDCEAVRVKIGDVCSNEISLNDENELDGISFESESTALESNEAEASESESTKFIAKGETTLMNFLSAASENGYSINDPQRSDSYVLAIAKGESESFEIQYMVEGQHVYKVEVAANGDETASAYRECIAAMAKALNPDIDEATLTESIELAISEPDSAVINSDTYFEFASAEKVFIVTH